MSDQLLLGGLVSWSDGDVDFDFDDLEDKGSYQHQMTSVHPYLAWSGSDIQLWGSLGYGQGELDIKLGRDQLTTDTRLMSLAAGVKGRLSHLLSLKSDLSVAQTDIDKTDTSAQQDISSQRLRLLLEMNLSTCDLCTTKLEAGLRYDHSDTADGLGAILDATLGYSNPASGLSMEARLHTLVGENDYTEWGVSGLIALTAAADGRGLTFRLSPSYGLAGSGTQGLWNQNQRQQNPIPGFGSSLGDYQARLDARLSYGFILGADSLLEPYSAMTYGNSNRYRLGLHWQGAARFDVNLYGERRVSTGAQAAHAILLEGRMQF